jgi:glycosyltransferase involved in cell wall biosynthesis
MHSAASSSVLLLDISRLIWRARRRGPTGIDRVELAYAQHFITASGDRCVYGVLHLFGLLFAVSPAGGRRFVEELSARWQGTAEAQRRGHLVDILKMYFHLFTSAWSIGPWLRRKLHVHAGSPTFLVVSHHHLARDYTIAHIRRSLGAKTVCLLHDLIPIEYPEYFIPGWEKRYRRLSGNIGRSFDAVITNSEATARSLRACLHGGPETPPSRVAVRIAPLGVRAFPRSRVTGHATQDHPHSQNQPYFVVLGTIEPRKNHLLLLNLWTRLAAATPAPPRLLVIGARGWENEQVVDMLERSRRLRGLVEEHNGLSDAEVGAFVHHARALLLPSFAEGFGLPLAEALASGVPAICSDIPVFREVGRDTPDYLDPLDLSAWQDAVLDYCRPDSPRRTAQLQRLAQWRAPRWADHFTAVEQLLDGLDTCRQEALPASAQQPL